MPPFAVTPLVRNRLKTRPSALPAAVRVMSADTVLLPAVH